MADEFSYTPLASPPSNAAAERQSVSTVADANPTAPAVSESFVSDDGKILDSKKKYKSWRHDQKMRLKRKRQRELRRMQELKQHEQELENLKQQKISELHKRKLEELERKKAQRQEHQAVQKKLIEENKNFRKPLFQVMEERFEQNVIKPESEKRQEFLQHLRSQYKSEAITQIKQFQQEYDERMRELRERRNKERHERSEIMSDMKSNHSPMSSNNNNNKKMYFSPLYSIVQQEEHERRLREAEHSKLKHDLMDKKRTYAQIVREHFAPQVDVQKKEEVEKRIQAEHEKEMMRVLRKSPIKSPKHGSSPSHCSLIR